MGLISDLLIKKPKLSNFNTSYINRFNCFVGGLFPVYRQTVEANTTVRCATKMAIRTQPMLAPLMGRFRVTLDYFFAPKRLYNPAYHSNSNSFDYFKTVHPNFSFLSVPFLNNVYQSNTYIDYMVKPGSLLDFLGVPRYYASLSGYSPNRFNAYYLLSYWDIFRNYYIDPQWSTYAVMFSSSSNPDAVSIRTSPLSTLEGYINGASHTQGYTVALGESFFTGFGSGILLRTYEPDLFNTYLNKQALTDLYTSNAAAVSDGVVSWQTIRTSAILTQMRELTQLIGGRFTDWLAGMFGQQSRNDMDIPQFICRCAMDVSSDEIISTADTGTERNQPIGSQAGRIGKFGSNFRRWNFHASEPGVILGLFSITPIVDYCQGIDPFLLKLNASDDFNPKTDNIGFQDLPYSWVSVAPVSAPVPNVSFTRGESTTFSPFSFVLGSHPSYSEYTTRCNEVHGDFSDSLSYWTNIRFFPGPLETVTSDTQTQRSVGILSKYIQPTTQGSFGSYIDPSLWNRPFAIQNPNAANWQVQVSFDVKTTFPKKKTPLPTQL